MIFNEINDNFRKVLIKNITTDKMLFIIDGKFNKEIYFKTVDENNSELFVWYITIINKEITFYSNRAYLGVSKFNKKAVAEKYMKRWTFEKINNKYKFYFENIKNYLTFEKNRAKVKEINEDY